jgi:cytosine/adenosine deaminase-related metal-dependent hydrolase
LRAVDLGGALLLPGLINAHCHLDYTGLAGQIPAPREFTDWIKSIMTAKAGLGYTDYAQSWLRGARELLEGGVTTVADIEAVPELLPEVLEATPLRIASFIEMTGVRAARDPQAIVDEAVGKAASLPEREPAHGLSPHALYSTTPALLALAARASRERGLRLVMHLAESEEESEMYLRRRGPLYEWLKGQRDMADTGAGSPVRAVERSGLLSDRFIAVHVNCLSDGDAACLGRSGASVAHCPRSHAYFGRRAFPWNPLTEAGVNICLGTDSLASVASSKRRPGRLDMFEEMRAFAAAHPDLSPEAILRLATVNGAAALGQSGNLGELREGARADLIAVPGDGRLAESYDAVLGHTGPVLAAMIGGRWVFRPPTLS